MVRSFDPDKLEDWQKEDPTCVTPESGPLTPHGEQQFRIEALRAASRIIAQRDLAKYNPYEETLNLAEHFARWLETGER